MGLVQDLATNESLTLMREKIEPGPFNRPGIELEDRRRFCDVIRSRIVAAVPATMRD
jgi:hypothetical protein